MTSFLPQIKLLHYLYVENNRRKIVAYCLDFDLVTSADTIAEAERRLDVIVRFHIERYLRTCGQSGLSDPSPDEFWRSYEQSLKAGRMIPANTLRIEVPSIVSMQIPYGEVKVVSAQAA